MWRPDSLMQRILGEIHYMPDSWKQHPHTLEVYNEFTHVFQFTVVGNLQQNSGVESTCPICACMSYFENPDELD